MIKQILFSLKKYFFFFFLWLFLYAVLSKIFLLKVPLFENHHDKTSSTLELFFKVVILGPVLEEIIFRLPLKFQNKELIISGLTSILIFPLFLGINLLTSSFYFYFLIIGIFWIGLIFIKKKYKEEKDMYLIIFSSLLFSVLHFLNFKDFAASIFYTYLFSVAPQFYAGYLLANLSLKNGFLYAIVFHIFINLILFISKVITTSFQLAQI